MDGAAQRITLSGEDWLLKGYIGEDWRWRDAHLAVTRDPLHWIEATVPGSVHHDLWQAGQIADPYRGQNTLLCEWVPARTWVYRKRFVLDEGLAGRRVQLCFEGVDYEATFYLNGEPLGRHGSMFAVARFEVGHLLEYGGENWLAVVLQPAPHEQPQVGRSSLVRTHKTRMNYWWDFCPRLVHLGLWDEVYLQVSGAVRIEDVFVRPQLNEDFSRATVDVTVTLSAVGEQGIMVEARCSESFTAEVTENAEKAEMGGKSERSELELESIPSLSALPSTLYLPPGASEHTVRLVIEEPRLWWPNGHGEQALYELDVDVRCDGEAGVSDARRVTFGVRQVAFLPNEGAPEEALPYTLAVNGRKIYIKGWNWVPMDVLYGVERPQKRARLLQLAQRAHVNVLRVWGGGLIEKEAFYDWCDRLGIFVWQEFVQSSSGIENVPPSDWETVRMMQAEAEAIVPRRRNHPSLLLWCGGNELQDVAGRPQDDGHPLLGALKATVQRLDPGRHWLPTSPSGPRFGNTLRNLEEAPGELHDVHGPWIYQGLEEQYTLFNGGTALLNSEFGVEGITNLRTLDDVMPRAQQRPIGRANPLWQHLGAWWTWEEHWDAFWGGLAPRDTAQVVRATQFLQAEGLRYAVEANRRRQFRNSGSLPWQFNEPYPMAACTSAVDYYARPKPAYYAVARAYAPLLLSARFARIAWNGAERFEASLWTSYSGEQALCGLALRAELVDGGGAVFARGEYPVAVPANASQQQALFDACLPQPGRASRHGDVFFLDLALCDGQGRALAAARYPFSQGATLAPLLELPAPSLEVRKEEEGAVTIANRGACAALGIWLDVARDGHDPGYAYFQDNYLHLLPGEQRTIAVCWQGIPPAERALGIQALNAEEVILDG